LTQPLNLDSLARDTFATLQRDLGTFVTLTAVFVFLPEMLLTLYGPPPPASYAEITPRLVALQMLLPAAVGAIAQLAIARLVVSAHDRGTGMTVGGALRMALLLLPLLLIALVLAALPISLGLMALVVPGLYLLGRLGIVLPLVAAEPANPIALLRRSWDLTEGNGWRAAGFIIALTIVLAMGAVLAAILGGAVGSVLTVVAGKGLGSFAATLVASAATAVFSAANAVATAVLYLHLRRG
jgi:hypothetical protein